MPLFQADHSSAAVAMPEKSLTRFSVVKKILPCWSLLLLLMMLICRYKERRGKKFNFYISFQRLVFLPMYPMIGFVLLPSFLTSSIIRGQAKVLWSGWKNLKVAAPQDFPISWYDSCVCVIGINHMVLSYEESKTNSEKPPDGQKFEIEWLCRMLYGWLFEYVTFVSRKDKTYGKLQKYRHHNFISSQPRVPLRDSRN